MNPHYQFSAWCCVGKVMFLCQSCSVHMVKNKSKLHLLSFSYHQYINLSCIWFFFISHLDTEICFKISPVLIVPDTFQQRINNGLTQESLVLLCNMFLCYYHVPSISLLTVYCYRKHPDSPDRLHQFLFLCEEWDTQTAHRLWTLESRTAHPAERLQ